MPTQYTPDERTLAFDLAEGLLRVGAVRLAPAEPFTWASGWRSPIYCDNRVTLSNVALRTLITSGLANAAHTHFGAVGAIAGVATAGIPQGALLANALELPFAYVRPKPKDHGTGQQIEGRLQPDVPILVVEDLVSTGGSSLHAVQALRAEGHTVAGLISVFTYGFAHAEAALATVELPFHSLCTYEILLDVAVEMHLVLPEQVALLQAWRAAPEQWGK